MNCQHVLTLSEATLFSGSHLPFLAPAGQHQANSLAMAEEGGTHILPAPFQTSSCQQQYCVKIQMSEDQSLPSELLRLTGELHFHLITSAISFSRFFTNVHQLMLGCKSYAILAILFLAQSLFRNVYIMLQYFIQINSQIYIWIKYARYIQNNDDKNELNKNEHYAT